MYAAKVIHFLKLLKLSRIRRGYRGNFRNQSATVTPINGGRVLLALFHPPNVTHSHVGPNQIVAD